MSHYYREQVKPNEPAFQVLNPERIADYFVADPEKLLTLENEGAVEYDTWNYVKCDERSIIEKRVLWDKLKP